MVPSCLTMSLGSKPKGLSLRSGASLVTAVGLFIVISSTNSSAQDDAFSALRLPAATHPSVVDLMNSGTITGALQRLDQDCLLYTSDAADE